MSLASQGEHLQLGELHDGWSFDSLPNYKQTKLPFCKILFGWFKSLCLCDLHKLTCESWIDEMDSPDQRFGRSKCRNAFSVAVMKCTKCEGSFL